MSAESSWKSIGTSRKQVNGKLQELASKSEDKTLLVDFASKILYHGVPREERDKYWDDGIHFTPDGYDVIGVMVFEALKPFL